jgi:putative aldouronate transport system substrate-binding protein
MVKKNVKIFSVVLTSLIAASMLTGCKKAKIEETNGVGVSVATSVSYPIKTEVKLTYWCPIGANGAAVYKNYGDSEGAKELTKKTGIAVEYIHSAIGQEKEAFNLMLASGDLPDIIQYDWYGFPGGPEKAIADGYIIKLNDVIDKYAPNLKKIYGTNPDVEKMVKTDSGTHYVFPQLNIAEPLRLYQGPIVRKDLLDELKLPDPVTIDDWTAMLKAFKAKGVELPFSYANNNSIPQNGGISGVFGTRAGLWVDNGKIKFGQMEPGYKQYLQLLADWYKDGLLDKNIVNVDGKTMNTNMASGKVGATFGNLGGGIKTWSQALEQAGSTAKLKGVAYPVLKKGEINRFGQKDFPYVAYYSAAISAKSKNVEMAAKFLDYGFSEEGSRVNNVGVEGVSYVKDSTGYPKLTDLVTNNPDKLPMGPALSKYARSGNGGGPYLQSMEYFEQYTLTMPEQKEAVKIWANTAEKIKMPPVSISPEESSEAAKIITDVNTYSDEMFLKFIMGKEPIENFDKFLAQLKNMKIDRYIQINQAAYDRFTKR